MLDDSNRNVIGLGEWSREQVEQLMAAAGRWREVVAAGASSSTCSGRVLGFLFFEASTRTWASFNAATQRLGGGVLPVSIEHSSVKKLCATPSSITARSVLFGQNSI